MSDKTLTYDIFLPRDRFNLHVTGQFKPRGITAIFGASGAGKSTLLRALAGFETPEKGRVILGDKTLFDSEKNIDLPAHKRALGYLFQDARLFSHLNVQGNLEYAAARVPLAKRVPAAKKVPEANKANLPNTISDIIDAFDLTTLLQKPVSTLSGGERQRVALARTVLSRPDVLLLDEPLAALDRRRKAELMPFIKTLSENFDVPVIFVSHDLWEVGTLADEILCLEAGQIMQTGTALSVLPKLQTAPEYHHDFMTWFDARLTARDEPHHAAIWSLSADHRLTLPLTEAQIGTRSRLSIRADDVSIALIPPQNISIQNNLKARVASITPLGARVLIELYLPDVDTVLPSLYAFITPLAQKDLGLKTGQPVTALVKSVSLSQL